MEKSENRAFRRACEKSKISFRKGCEKICTPCKKFANPTLICKTLCEIKKGVRTQFTTLKSILQACANSKNPCENKRSLKSLFKDLQSLLLVRTPHSTLRNPQPHCEILHHLAAPKLPSVFSPLDVPRPTIRRGNLHLSPHFEHGAH